MSGQWRRKHGAANAKEHHENNEVIIPSLFWKIFDETTPIRLASGTPMDVRTTRRPSLAMLLLYHTSRSTEGAEVPLFKMSSGLLVRRKREKVEDGIEGHLPGHHEASEVCYVQLVFHVNTCVDHHSQEGK